MSADLTGSRRRRLLDEVRMPPRFTVFEIGRDYVLGRWTDDFDVEHVQLYELVKG